MTKNYKRIYGIDGKLAGIFEPTIGCIPPDPANTDYQQYLKWLEEGNTPLPPSDSVDEPNPEQGGV